ncbi:MAG: hypothetical protein IIB64_06310 [Proteobacteria bacterium]|nr:hypothetical protein [Pseudomonadota bacterium]
MQDQNQTRIAKLLPGLMESPALFVHEIRPDKGVALVIEADRSFYRNAVFLDQRVLNQKSKGAWVPLDLLWRHVDAGSGGRIAPASFIFHTGHSGSTLISRLLDEVPNVLGIREPLPLRTMAVGFNGRESLPEGAFEEAFRRTYQLLVRRFSPEQQVIIKATSMCNNIAHLLLRQNSANRGLLLFVKLEVYLANMLDKKETPDIESFFTHRLTGLKKLVRGMDLEMAALSRPEKTAFSWLAEAAEFNSLNTGQDSSKILLMDFDRFLSQKDIHLGMIFSHFGIPGAEEALGRVLASPVFKSYAKQPDFAFTPENREAILNESRATNKAGIDEGLKFVEGLIESHPALEGVLTKTPLS